MKTGYEISWSDFQQLLSEPTYRQKIAPLIRDWFGYQLIPLEKSVSLRDSFGTEVSTKRVYDAIQADVKQQYDLYQVAMSLWR